MLNVHLFPLAMSLKMKSIFSSWRKQSRRYIRTYVDTRCEAAYNKWEASKLQEIRNQILYVKYHVNAKAVGWRGFSSQMISIRKYITHSRTSLIQDAANWYCSTWAIGVLQSFSESQMLIHHIVMRYILPTFDSSASLRRPMCNILFNKETNIKGNKIKAFRVYLMFL